MIFLYSVEIGLIMLRIGTTKDVVLLHPGKSILSYFPFTTGFYDDNSSDAWVFFHRRCFTDERFIRNIDQIIGISRMFRAEFFNIIKKKRIRFSLRWIYTVPLCGVW